MRQKAVSGAIFIEAGAEEAIVPALWGEDTFIEKAGGSEIISQMWAFNDKAGRACCLIPEATALFQERSEALLNGRREAVFFYVARCYRYERPQAGRYREFTQLGWKFSARHRSKPCNAARPSAQAFWTRWGWTMNSIPPSNAA
ncbi:s II aminoacyl-tRNA synthetase [Pseudomonas savastanoi pv. fraxini]|nr:class II aminoacyl-tRNA synthetase [Pseudomonas savastanoi pv. fraxini]RMR63327.1 s II aminoacyl-tRNA synthetase [Pseudomonas savastanoi pv. fraxini]RMR66122.1 s II aminoacyl-tRNA synthetase [Pseudomonas savastanoi pv. fraxini]RMR68769.1 s II aminoacyl-tRNA synthetase [Pseudomonas savastanoi pv. fraxini]